MIVIYTAEGDCSECTRALSAMAKWGVTYAERKGEDLMNGVIADSVAMAQLAMQDMALPVIVIDGLAFTVDELESQAARRGRR